MLTSGLSLPWTRSIVPFSLPERSGVGQVISVRGVTGH